MKLIVVYVVFVLFGDLGSYAVGRIMEHYLSQSLALSAFLACFFLVFWLAWVLAVKATKPHAA